MSHNEPDFSRHTESRCYWQYEPRNVINDHDQRLTADADIVIIGAGFAGLATACRIAEFSPHTRVTVLEANTIGYGASGRNGGLLSPLAAPVWLAGATRDRRQGDALRLLYEESHAVARWAARCAPNAEVEPTRLCLSPQGALTSAGLEEVADVVGRAGIPIENAHVNEPTQSLFLDAHMVHPYRLASGLAAYARQRGVRIVERCRVRTVQSKRSAIKILIDDGSAIEAYRVVLATNAYSSSVDLGFKTPGKVVRNFMLATELLNEQQVAKVNARSDFVVELNRKYIFYRLHGGRLLFGGIDKFGPPRSGNDFEIPQAVQETLCRDLSMRFGSGSNVPIAFAWGGCFHMTRNELPVIRRCPENPAIILNICYGGTGVALSLALAPVAASLALDQKINDPNLEFIHTVMDETGLPVAGGLALAGRVARRLFSQTLNG